MDKLSKICYIRHGLILVRHKKEVEMKKIDPKKLHLKKLPTRVDKRGLRGLRRPRA